MPSPAKYRIGMKFSLQPLLLLCLFAVTAAYAGATPENRYMSMSLDELMNIKITSVSKNEEVLSDAAAAVFVITQEDIRRSGATTIPEALRMAPGIQVARIDSNKWAITSRGFNGKYANKLLVLLDGRTLYTPLYSGVYWDVQDTMLEDIDRIEVIRGPGATLWGANAVNGVINIITRSASESQGILAAGGTGNQERGFGQVRYGGKFANFSYRIYGKGFYRASFPYGSISESRTNLDGASGSDANDQWSQGRGGFRTDWALSRQDHLTVQGDIYAGYSGQTTNFEGLPEVGVFKDQGDLSGGNIITRWKHSFSPDRQLTIQFYYDRTERRQYEYNARRNTYDLDMQQTFKLPWRQSIIAGFGYRYSSDTVSTNLSSLLDPDDKILHWISGFVQDEVAVIPCKLKFVFGSKFESNDYTGFEFQPSARILWKPFENHTVWAAISRAVRTPSRADENLHVAAFDIPSKDMLSPGIKAVMLGNDDFKSEKLLAYEAGYRLKAGEKISIDIAGFLNDYSKLRTLEPESTEFDFTNWQVVREYRFKNNQSGRTYGIEVASTMKFFRWWTLYSTYTWLQYNVSDDSGVKNILKNPANWSPDQQFSLRSYITLPYNLEFDTAIYYSGGLDDYDIPAYTRVDLRLGWKPANWLDISLMLENLFDNQHPEFGGSDEGLVPTEVPRSFYTKLTFKF